MENPPHLRRYWSFASPPISISVVRCMRGVLPLSRTVASLIRGARRAMQMAFLTSLAAGLMLATTEAAEVRLEATVLAVTGSSVSVARAGAVTWDAVHPSRLPLDLMSGDRIRTGDRCQASLRLRDNSIVHLDELTTATLDSTERSVVIELLNGIMSFFHRD